MQFTRKLYLLVDKAWPGSRLINTILENSVTFVSSITFQIYFTTNLQLTELKEPDFYAIVRTHCAHASTYARNYFLLNSEDKTF